MKNPHNSIKKLAILIFPVLPKYLLPILLYVASLLSYDTVRKYTFKLYNENNPKSQI